MGLESASMRRCLLWYNFIVRGTRRVRPQTETDPLYGGFGNGNVCGSVCVCNELNVFLCHFMCLTLHVKDMKQSDIVAAADMCRVIHIQPINRSIRQYISHVITETLTLCVINACVYTFTSVYRFRRAEVLNAKILMCPTALAQNGEITTT